MFIPTTVDQARYLAGKGVPEDRIERIPNFSSVAPCTAPAAPRTGPLVFASYGRMVQKKGFDVLLEAFRAVLDGGLEARSGRGWPIGFSACRSVTPSR